MRTAETTKVLVVSDWVDDPQAVARSVAAMLGRAPGLELTVVVPARLHGLDWVGDPHSSVPCAESHLRMLSAACAAFGLDVVRGSVGDPDAVTAATDALLCEHFVQVLVTKRPRRWAPTFLRLARRLARCSGREVRAVPLPRSATRTSRHCGHGELSFAA